jgi:hypothetical protein
MNFPFQFCINYIQLYTISDGIPAELIQAGGEILRSKIHKLIKSI